MKRSVGHYKNWVSILNVLLSGPVSLADLVRKTGVDYDTIRPLMNELRKGEVVHIMGWRQDSCNRWAIAVYQLGMGVDAKKPKAKTGAQRMQARTHRKTAAEEDELFQPIGKPFIQNATIDNALRSWL